MINPKRVRRIKNVIYGIIILILLFTVVLMCYVGIRLLFALGPLSEILGQAQAAAPPSIASQQLPESSGEDSGFIISPQNQSTRTGEDGADTSTVDEADPGTDDRSTAPGESGGTAPAEPLSAGGEDAGTADDAGFSGNASNNVDDDASSPSDTTAPTGQLPNPNTGIPSGGGSETGTLPMTGAGIIAA